MALLLLLLTWALAGSPEASPERSEAALRPVVEAIWQTDLAGGVVLDQLDAQAHEVMLTLHHPDGRFAAELALRHPDHPGRRSQSLSMAVRAPFSQARTPEQAATLDAIAAVARHIDQADHGQFSEVFLPPSKPPWLRFGWGLPFALVMALGAAVWAAVTKGHERVFRPNHAVPVLIQLTLYAYWITYVAAVSNRLIDIAAQLAFAYAFEAALAYGRGRTWRVSFAPMPIVFSTNLFVWFVAPHVQCAAIAMALASKEWLVRDGKHIFNPSAFGIAVLAVLAIAVPSVGTWGTPTPDIELNLPPNMMELMLVLSLGAQLRFPIVLVPFAASVVLVLAGQIGMTPPNPFWPATFLILLLFATDPRTLPQTNPGRFLYGIGLGGGIAVGADALGLIGEPDVYSKVLAIPVLNYLAPQLDAWGARLPARVLDAVDPARNRLHVALWVVVALFAMGQYKPAAFQALHHWQNETPGIVATPGAFPVCEDNPAWCRPAAFVSEARMWLR